MKTTKDDKQNFYICGQCSQEIFYLATDEPLKECPYCGYRHQARDKHDVPSVFKTSLNQF